jgi:hypothetical protein
VVLGWCTCPGREGIEVPTEYQDGKFVAIYYRRTCFWLARGSSKKWITKQIIPEIAEKNSTKNILKVIILWS